MKFETHLTKYLPYIIAFLAVLTLVGMDYKHLSDEFRDGRTRYLLLAFSLCGGWALIRCNPWWALFASYSFALWVFKDFQICGAIDILLIAACLVVGDAIRRTVDRSRAFSVIAWLALIEGVYGLFQIAKIDPFIHFIDDMVGKASGTFGHYTMLGPFVALGVCHFLSKKKFIHCVLCLIGVVATGSTMSLLSMIAGVFYLFWRRNPKWAAMLASTISSVMGIGYYFFPKSEFFSFSGRLSIWPHGLDAWATNFIFGGGPGSWSTMKNIITGSTQWDQLHNDFLQAGVEQGAIGLGIILIGLFFLFKKAQKLDPVIGAWATVLCVNALANFPMHVPAYGLLAGYLASLTHNNTK